MTLFQNNLVVGALLTWVGIAIGWILQEATPHLQARRERKKAIALALTDLWEIQYRLAALHAMLTKVESLREIPPQVKAQMWIAMEQQIHPDSAELHKRYSESVTTLAALDPVLGFWLRSKDVVRRLFTFENSIAAQNPEAASFWFLMQGPLMSEADKALRDAIRELAKKHSRATHRQVLERLARPPQDIPKELEEWISRVIPQVKNTPPSGSERPPEPDKK
jgi:hypothetical protein